jgi:hypothetical protein
MSAGCPGSVLLAETAMQDNARTSRPIGAKLSEEVPALVIQAHPTQPPGSRYGSAQAQRVFGGKSLGAIFPRSSVHDVEFGADSRCKIMVWLRDTETRFASKYRLEQNVMIEDGFH